MTLLQKIYNEDREMVEKFVPAELQEFTKKWQERILKETLDREL